MLVEAKDKVFCSYIWKLWWGSPSAKGLFREHRTFLYELWAVQDYAEWGYRPWVRLIHAAGSALKEQLMSCAGNCAWSWVEPRYHRPIGYLYPMGLFCYVRGWWYYERQESHENKAYPCDHLLYHWVLRLWCSGICLLVIMERDYIRQARVSHLSAHMDSIILVQHIFLSACLQGEKRRLQAMGYQKKGKARFERHFNGAERSASLLLDICVCFAVYWTAELQIIWL